MIVLNFIHFFLAFGLILNKILAQNHSILVLPTSLINFISHKKEYWVLDINTFWYFIYHKYS